VCLQNVSTAVIAAPQVSGTDLHPVLNSLGGGSGGLRASDEPLQTPSAGEAEAFRCTEIEAG
jgi:hypothetical protein